MHGMKLLRQLPATVFLLVPLCAIAQDTTVLGIALGSRFLLPSCGPTERAFPTRHCFIGSPLRLGTWDAEEYQVLIPNAGTPPYVRGELRVYTVKGIVESVQINTWGIEAQHGVLEDLRKKYGEPSHARQEKPKGLRSRFPTQYAEWNFKDFLVKFDGTTGSIDWGRIVISSRRYQILLDQTEKHAPAGAPRQAQ